MPRVALENNINTITSSQSVQQVQESLVSEIASVSEVIKRPVLEVVQNISNLPKVHFPQQSSNVPSGIPSRKGRKEPNISKMVDLASTSLSISARLDNKPRPKYGLFDKFSLAVIGACEVAKILHVFLNRSYQHIQKISRHFYGT